MRGEGRGDVVAAGDKMGGREEGRKEGREGGREGGKRFFVSNSASFHYAVEKSDHISLKKLCA
jgi:hypothetical protein